MISTGAGAVINTAKVQPGTHTAIIGLGGVGLMSMLALQLSGARSVIAIDMLDDKLKLAGQLGATHTIKASAPDVVEQDLAHYEFISTGSLPPEGSVREPWMSYTTPQEATKRHAA